MFEIKTATSDDLLSVVKIHRNCFIDSFSSSIGKRLLFEYYNSYFTKYPDLFIVAKNQDEIIGYAMGYLCGEQNTTKLFLKTHFFALFLRTLFGLITFDRRVWKRFFRKPTRVIFSDDVFSKVQEEKKGDLLSICVLKQYRGTGVSNKLITDFCEHLKICGREYCVLTAQKDNNRARRFYEKNNYTMYKSTNKYVSYFKKLC